MPFYASIVPQRVSAQDIAREHQHEGRSLLGSIRLPSTFPQTLNSAARLLIQLHQCQQQRCSPFDRFESGLPRFAEQYLLTRNKAHTVEHVTEDIEIRVKCSHRTSPRGKAVVIQQVINKRLTYVNSRRERQTIVARRLHKHRSSLIEELSPGLVSSFGLFSPPSLSLRVFVRRR